MSIILAMTMMMSVPAALAAVPKNSPANFRALAAAPKNLPADLNRPVLAGSTVPVNYVKAPNAEAYDRFGNAIAISGDTLVVGAKEESGDITSTAGSPNNFASAAGAVYVYVRSGSDWVLQQYLKSPRAQEDAEFGGSVAIDGDTIAVGEVGNGDYFLYMFTRTGGVWTHQSTVTPTIPSFGNDFGETISIDGDTMVVGDPNEDGSSTSTVASPNDLAEDAGAAYVFTRSVDGTWTQQVYLKASNVGEDDGFGARVKVDGDTIVVSAPGEDGSITSTMASPNELTEDAGAVYVFTRSVDGTWTQQAYLKASETEKWSFFGTSVALENDTLIVGQEGNNHVAYAFVRSDGVWTQQAELRMERSVGYGFGASVALNGNFALISAGNDDFLGQGSLQVFLRSGTTWTHHAHLAVANMTAYDSLGYGPDNVAFDGMTVVAGADGEDGSVTSTLASPNELASSAGAIYMFQGPGSTDLNLREGKLTPAFITTTRDYTAAVSDSSSSIVITTSIGWLSALTVTAATPCDTSRGPVVASTPQFLTTCPLATDPNAITFTNLITFTINDGDGVEQNYSVAITRTSSDASLSDLALSVGDLTPAFVSTTTSYVASVANEIASVVVTPTTSHANATYIVSNAAGACAADVCALDVGANTITITVTAEDEATTQEYVVTITRAAPPTATPTATLTQTPIGPTPTSTSTSTPGGPTPTPTSTSTPGGPTPTPASTSTPAPTATPIASKPYVSPKSGAVTTSTVSIIGPTGSGFTGAKRVSVNGVKMFHVVRSDKKIDFTMKPGVAGATVDVVLVKADDTVITITQAYTFEGPTRASGNTASGAVLTTTSGVTITVPPQSSARPAEPAIAGSLVITYMPVEFPAEPPGDVPLSFFKVSMDVDGVGVSTLTNPATLELPVDPAAVPIGQIARLYEWVAASHWSPVPGQSYDPAAGLVTAPIQRLDNYALMSAPAHQWWFPLVTLE